MAFLRRIQNPRVPPLGRVEIDWRNPITRGLVAFWSFGSESGLNDLCGNVSTLAPQSGARTTVTPGGPGWLHTATSGSLFAPTPAALQLTTVGSLFWLGQTFGSVTGGLTMGYVGVVPNNVGTGGFDNYCLAHSSTDALDMLINSTSPTLGGTVGTGLTSLGVTFTSGSTAQGYKNGATTGAAATITTIPAYTGTSQVHVGGYPFYTARSPNAASNAAGIWNRILSSDEMAALAAEPFSILRPVPSRKSFYLPSSVPPPSGRRPFIFFIR